MSPDGKWKLLHIGDVKLATPSNIGTPVAAMGTLGGPSGNLGQPAGQPSAFGGSPSTLGGTHAATGLRVHRSSAPWRAPPGGQPGTSTSPTGAFGSQTSTTGSSSSMVSSTNAIGGGVIIGVASLSEKEGLHVFNEKTHYNEWYFFYDPNADSAALIQRPLHRQDLCHRQPVSARPPALWASSSNPALSASLPHSASRRRSANPSAWASRLHPRSQTPRTIRRRTTR